MKIKLYKSVALCSLLALAGCHDFEELNTNKSLRTDLRPDCGECIGRRYRY